MKSSTKNIVFNLEDEKIFNMQEIFGEKMPIRKTRNFVIYSKGQAVLHLEDKPGYLLSSASPNPAGPAKHQFINAQALNAAYEDKLASILEQSGSFNEYIIRLIENEFDILSYDNIPLSENLSEGFRIVKNKHLAGVLWNRKGQFTSVQLQPEPGYLQFDHAAITVYDLKQAGLLLRLIKNTRNFNELLEEISKNGLELISLFKQ